MASGTAVMTGTANRQLEPWLAQLLGAAPRRLELFETAVTHRSADPGNYERLEFLGDAVLNLIIAEALYLRFGDADEGSLSRLRASLVSSAPLAQIGAEIRIGDVLRLGSGELKTGGFRRESILADATEALIGALYLDAGIDAARGLILRLYDARLAALPAAGGLKDAKTRLQELLQARGESLPVYRLESAVGEPHEQTFFVACELALSRPPQAVFARGSGSSRRAAEQQAAEAALAKVWAGDA
jgi:ribonuclease III